MGAVVRGLVLVVGAIGVLGLAGYLVSAHLLFPQYLFAGIAAHTAMGLVLLACGLQSAFRRLAWNRPLFARDDDRITFIAATVLAAATLLAGLVTFSVLQDRAQTLVRDDLLASLADRADVFQDLIALRESNARIAATRPAAARNLRVIRSGKDDGSNLANLKAVVDSFAKEGFSAIAYHDLDGRPAASAGSFAAAPALSVRLSTPASAELLWSGGFVLRHRLPVYDAGAKAGEVLAEQPLPVLTRLTRQAPGGGETWDMGICARRAELLHCFPQRLNPEVFSIPVLNVAGEPLPMTRALSGGKGTIITRDYRGQHVVAAYGPIGGTGLGIVLKVDAAEVFLPIREQLQLALVLLLLLVAAGTLLLRAQIRPLASKVVEANAQLSRRSAELEAANKELEAFSYSVSHDLRAPLRHIHGFADLLKEEAEGVLTGEAKRYLGVIRSSVDQMGQLIDDLLAFSRMARVDLSRAHVDMADLARQAAEDAQAAAPDREIEWAIGSLAPVLGDRTALKQVWANLFTNAVKYTRKRGTAKIEVGCRSEGAQVEFCVKDNGVGFDMAYAGKLFGVFQRLHRSQEFEGTGIGLANVRRIVTRHGGRTWAESRPDQGASFYFTIPAFTENEP
jgi:signal transduction histidine kinase